METIKAKYIVVRQPANNNEIYRNPMPIIHIVITHEELQKKINAYFAGKIERSATVYAPIDLFAYLIRNRKTYTYAQAVSRARYLNKKYHVRRTDNENRRSSV